MRGQRSIFVPAKQTAYVKARAIPARSLWRSLLHSTFFASKLQKTTHKQSRYCPRTVLTSIRRVVLTFHRNRASLLAPPRAVAPGTGWRGAPPGPRLFPGGAALSPRTRCRAHHRVVKTSCRSPSPLVTLKTTCLSQSSPVSTTLWRNQSSFRLIR